MQTIIHYSGKLAMLLVEHPFWTVIISASFLFFTFVYVLHKTVFKNEY